MRRCHTYICDVVRLLVCLKMTRNWKLLVWSTFTDTADMRKILTLLQMRCCHMLKNDHQRNVAKFLLWIFGKCVNFFLLQLARYFFRHYVWIMRMWCYHMHKHSVAKFLNIFRRNFFTSSSKYVWSTISKILRYQNFQVQNAIFRWCYVAKRSIEIFFLIFSKSMACMRFLDFS